MSAQVLLKFIKLVERKLCFIAFLQFINTEAQNISHCFMYFEIAILAHKAQMFAK